jgi:uncharacterized membrane protein
MSTLQSTELIKHDILFYIAIASGQYILQQNLNDPTISPMNEYLLAVLGVMLGFIIYDYILFLFIDKMTSNLNKVSSSIIVDIFKFTTIFVVREFIVTYIRGQTINFNHAWVLEMRYTILGYIVYDLFASFIPNFGQGINPALHDMIKVGLGNLSATYALSNYSSPNLISTGGLAIGAAVYHFLFYNKIIIN